MNYLELEIRFPDSGFADIIVAELSEIGFASFSVEEHIVLAYITGNDFDKDQLSNCFFINENKEKLQISQRIVKAENWNRKWEENFDPVSVEDKIYVRAPFHSPQPHISIEILIMPKMAFGTGHHATTYLILNQMLNMNFVKKSVADLGCGSGILAIAASKLGAASVTAVDIDEWSVINTGENVEANHVKNVVIKQGTAADIQNKFDVVLANINRNVLLAEMEHYSRISKAGAELLLSGFYGTDLNKVSEAAAKAGFELKNVQEKDKWVSVLYLKK